jgi:hydrogenase/urease accessory protein HupE
MFEYQLCIWIVRWLIFVGAMISDCVVGLETISIAYCECKPAVLSLMGRGLFAASPVRPVFAFDLSLLHLASSLFVHIPPNVSGWCSGLASHLHFRGFTEFTEVGGLGLTYAPLFGTD